MRLSFFVLLVAYNLHLVQMQILKIFIGQGSNSLYFAMRYPIIGWDWGLNYCHNSRLMPGSIETEADHQLITNFLNTTTSIDDENRFLWLAATDHRKEGTFQWLWNMEDVTVGAWSPGMPSLNRTANCLAINRDGLFIEDSCFNTGRNYYTLCEAQNFYSGTDDDFEIKANRHDSNKVNSRVTYQTPRDASTDNQLNQQTLQTLTVIGQVGNKIYFANDQMVSWTQSLDLCHSVGMRLATPEEPEQFDFIQEYVTQQSWIYYLGGTDRLSVSCLRSNTEYRWLYSGNPVANQTNLNSYFWYMCTCMSPQGLFATGCATGGGAFARTVCEIDI